MQSRVAQRLIVFTIGLVFLFIPTGIALADIGPKPTLEFHFSYPHGQELAATDAVLLECESLDCPFTFPLEEHRTSVLTCEGDRCQGTIFFGGKPAYRLKVLFSDNQSRISNPFKVSMMRNVFDVKVDGANLLVRKNFLLSNNASTGIMLCIFPFTAVGILLLFVGLMTSNLLI
jgi:hypothetical protein